MTGDRELWLPHVPAGIHPHGWAWQGEGFNPAGGAPEEHWAGTELYPDQCTSTHISTRSFETLHLPEQTDGILWLSPLDRIPSTSPSLQGQELLAISSLLLVKPGPKGALQWGCACSCPLCCVPGAPASPPSAPSLSTESSQLLYQVSPRSWSSRGIPQNHGTMEWLVLEGTSADSILCQGQGHLPLFHPPTFHRAQGSLQPGLGSCRGGRSLV